MSSDDNNDDVGEESQRNKQVHPPQVQCDTNTLFVGGLHPRIGDLHLQKLFSPYGRLFGFISCHISPTILRNIRIIITTHQEPQSL